MLEECAALQLEEIDSVFFGETGIEHFLDCDSHAGASGATFAPVEDQLLRFELCEHFAAHGLDGVSLLVGEVRAGTSEDVKDGEFFLAEVLADVAAFLFGEVLGECNQLLEELIDRECAFVVVLDHLMEAI